MIEREGVYILIIIICLQIVHIYLFKILILHISKFQDGRHNSKYVSLLLCESLKVHWDIKVMEPIKATGEIEV